MTLHGFATVVVVAALAGVPLSVRLVANNNSQEPLLAPQPGGHDPDRVIARAGEWVTYPNGVKVCLLSADLVAADNLGNSAFWRRVCTLWAEAPPVNAQPIPGWIRRDPWAWRVNVGGRWVP